MLQKSELSILIPVYNDVCVELVGQLARQAERLVAQGLRYEIIVADDGSTDQDSIRQNEQIAEWPHVSLLKHTPNMGRACIRNYLAQEAHFPYLLFLDCDVALPHDDFLLRYLQSRGNGVVCGGISAELCSNPPSHNLRYAYELKAEPAHRAEQRSQSPYRSFRTTSFLIPRQVMLSHPFDERFRNYGYEDVLLGKLLRADDIAIEHIDNPVCFTVFEDNPRFVDKTEEGLRTLWQFREELSGYNQLLDFLDRMPLPLRWLLRCWHRLAGSALRRNLSGSRPHLTLYNIYRLGYLASL